MGLRGAGASWTVVSKGPEDPLVARGSWAWMALIPVLSWGCESEPSFSHEGLPVIQTGERRELNRSDTLAIPYLSVVVDDYLVVVDLASDLAVHVLNRFDGSLLGSYGRKGEGPGEFQYIFGVDPDPAANAVWVFDAQLSRTTRIDIDRLLIDADSVVPEVLNLRAEGELTGPMWTSRGYMLSPGFFGGSRVGRLARLDSSGNQLGMVGSVPPGDTLIPISIRQAIHQSTAAANPSRDRIVLASNWVPRIEVFDPQDTLSIAAHVPFEWDFTVGDLYSRERWMVRPQWPEAYVRVASSNRWFMALFSGRSRDDSDDRRSLGDFVHVFDWNGRFLGYIRLAVSAVSIAVDPEGSTLYAVEWDPVPTVSAYELGEPVRNAQ